MHPIREDEVNDRTVRYDLLKCSEKRRAAEAQKKETLSNSRPTRELSGMICFCYIRRGLIRNKYTPCEYCSESPQSILLYYR